MQRTMTIQGRKVTIKSRPRTSAGNLIGWHVSVNGMKFKLHILRQEKAREVALQLWLQQNPLQDA